jgi:hypothetical protein
MLGAGRQYQKVDYVFVDSRVSRPKPPAAFSQAWTTATGRLPPGGSSIVTPNLNWTFRDTLNLLGYLRDRSNILHGVDIGSEPRTGAS